METASLLYSFETIVLPTFLEACTYTELCPSHWEEDLWNGYARVN